MFLTVCARKLLLISLLLFSSSLYAQAPAYNERTEQMELEIRRLTGEVETLKYQNLRLKKDLQSLRNEISVKLEMLSPKEDTPQTDEVTKAEQPSSDAQQPSQKGSNDIQTILKESENGSTASIIYEAAQGDLQRKRYKSAQNGFERIIADYPDDRLAPNAYYWLGETFYARKNYSKAAMTFLEGKKKFPESTKAGHSLYKLAMSLHYLGESEEACLTLDEVAKTYLPKDDTLRPVLAKGRSRVGCS
ncbi:MAG: tol-pal system protein YbgF [Pseudomonadota bacterium]